MRETNNKEETAGKINGEKTARDTKENEAPSSEKNGRAGDSAKRGIFLRIVAGIYLIYTAYELGDSYLKKEEGSSLGFFLAGIAFAAVGVYLICIVIRDYLREEKQKKAEDAAGRHTETGEESEKAGQPSKMSISERAHLVEHLTEAEESPEKPEA